MSGAAFPTLAALARAASATRGAGRIARSTVAVLSALGEARLARGRNRVERSLAMSAAAAEVCAVQGIEVDLVGVAPTQPCVIVANHVSYLDPLAILAHLPAAPLAKAEVAAWPVIGAAAASMGGIFVRRDEPMARARALRAALHALRDGASVLNFPEGTTTDGARLLPFHRGIFGLAMLANVPVVPVALRFDDPRCAWTGNASFVPHFWWLSNRPHARVRMTVRAPMWPRTTEAPEDFAARVRSAIALMLGRVTMVAVPELPGAVRAAPARLQEIA